MAKPAGVEFVQVESAAEMLEAVLRIRRCSMVIKSAAVADYRPKEQHTQKMKKQDGDSSIELERTTDILKTLGERRKTKSLSVLLRKQMMRLLWQKKLIE